MERSPECSSRTRDAMIRLAFLTIVTFGALLGAQGGLRAAPGQPAVRERPAPALSGSPSPTPGASASPTPGPMAALQWRNLGPAVAGGRLAAVAGSDRDPALVYIGSAGGGVWKSTDGTTNWTPVFDAQDVGSIGAVAIAPNDPSDVWVGSGESNPRNDVSYGDGMYRSTDGGKSWSHLGLEKSYAISKIALDPRDSRTAVVAALGSPFADSTERGVYRTLDGGKTWMKTLYLGPRSGAADLTRGTKDPNVLFASIWQFHRSTWHLDSGGPTDGLYRSSDGGATWSRVTGNGFPSGITGRIGVAIAPSDARRVYALVESPQGLLWRSEDGGAHWKLVSTNTLIDERPFYYTRIFVDPHDENHLFTTSVRLAESKDGGATWQLSGKHLHGDHHDIWFSADGNVVLEGNDGGVGVSRDNGASWEWRNNVPIEQVYRVATDARLPYAVCAGLQDNGSWCGPNDDLSDEGLLPRDWSRVGGGDGTWTLPDPTDPDWIWGSSGGGDNGGSLVRYNLRTRLSLDVSPYVRNQNVVPPSTLRYRFNWEAPLAFSPQDGRVAYYGGNVLFRTADRGVHWRAVSPDLTRNIKARQVLSGTPLRLDVTGAETYDTILDIAPSNAVANELWVSTDDGRVQLTRDGGRHWHDVTMPGVGPDARVPTIAASYRDPGTAYAVVDRHFTGDRTPYIEVTHDYGHTWRSIVAGLPSDQFARAICEDPRDSNLLFAGLENSVWWSDDAGATWRSLQQNLPPSSVRDLRVQTDAGDLIAGTHGRGIWILDDIAPLEGAARAKALHVALFAPRVARHWEQYTPTVNVRASGEGPPGPAIFTYYLGHPARTSPNLDVLDAHGALVRRLDSRADDETSSNGVGAAATNVAGFNRVIWDLTSQPPVPWYRAPKWNRGPESGADLMPATYTVRLSVDGRQYRQPLIVAPDPRAQRTVAEEAAHVAFVRGLVDRLSRIDIALNTLDNVQLQLPMRIALLEKRPTATATLAQARAALVEANRHAYTLSSHPENGQDNDFLRDLLRERVQSLLGIASTLSPTAEQTRESGVLGREIDRALGAYDAFMRDRVRPLQTALAAVGVSSIDLFARPSKADSNAPQDEHGNRRENS